MSVLLFLVLLVQLAQTFILNRILMQLSNPDFTKEDESVKAMTDASKEAKRKVTEAKGRLPKQQET